MAVALSKPALGLSFDTIDFDSSTYFAPSLFSFFFGEPDFSFFFAFANNPKKFLNTLPESDSSLSTRSAFDSFSYY